MASRTHVLASLLLAALAAGCAAKQKPQPKPNLVVVAQPLQRQVQDWDDYVGQFEAVNDVSVRPRVSGYIQSLGFKDGQNVKAGQLLFQIDPRPYQALLSQAQGQLAHAKAALADAKVELNRAQALLAAKAGSQQDYDTRAATEHADEADLATADANVKTAQLNVSFTRVTAPISGRISDARATVGNLVTQDSTILTTIVSLDPIRFNFEGPESLFLKYKRQAAGGRSEAGGAPVEIRLQDEPTYRWPGHLEFIDNALDTSSGTIRARAIVRNPSNFLTPGMFGHMRLLGSQPYTGMLIPDQAVVQDQSRQLIYVVAHGVVGQRVVTLGPLIDGLRVVRSGLQPTDWVVIDGITRAHPGGKVTVRNGRIQPQADDSGTEPDTAPPPSSATFTSAR
ncbi:MAG TPA: efflux RND transporter periplasmic adaptor subunit [Caulobacteraceae bacterium]|jgi:RND family efflux transporter MFP subunit|nr:efflux RND transporter periplasmic adaptor subunit [Caulobacteraceae bacterium]